MASLEKFSLRWNDFQENTTSAFSNLRDDQQFTDVTLVSEDGQSMEAHKIILAASSPFFKNILKLNKHTNPLIYLKGFKAKELHSLIDFIYHGVANIYQDNLNLFLAKAEELRLKGLTEGKEEKKKQEPEAKTLQDHSTTSADKTNLIRDNVKKEHFTNLLEDNEYDSNSTTIVSTNYPSTNVSFNGGTAEGLKSTLWSMIAQEGTVLTCTSCGKTMDRSLNRNARQQMEQHVESIHVDGLTYSCPRCDKIFRSKMALHKHIPKCHNRQ